MNSKNVNSSKKYVATAVTTAMVASIATPAIVPSIQAAGNFSDVSSDAFYAKAVNELASKGIIGGYSDGTFQPNKQVTRAEVAKILAYDLGVTTEQVISKFIDVKEKDWFFQPVTALAQAGGINGYEDGTFLPNKTITRAEMASLIVKAYSLKSESSVSTPFTDVSLNSWYAGAVKTLYANNVTSGKGSVHTFAPNDPVTRGEMAVFVHRASQLKSGVTQQVDNSNVIEEVTATGIVIGGTTYAVADSVKGILATHNAAVLKGAEIEFEESNGVISKVDSLQLNAAGSSSATEFANNLVMDGKGNSVGELIVDANYITVKNLTVSGDLKITENLANDFYSEKLIVKGNTVINGGDSNTVVFKDGSLQAVELAKEGVHFEAKGSTTVGTITVSKNAKITSEKTISKIKVDDDVKLTLGSDTEVGNIELPKGVKLEDVITSNQQRKNVKKVNGNNYSEHISSVGGGNSPSSDRSDDDSSNDTISFGKTITSAGTYGPSSGIITVDGDLEITTANVTIQNIKITGDLILGEGIGEGDVTLKGVTVVGQTIVNGGGSNSIHFEDSVLATVIVNKNTGAVRIVATGSTRVIEVQLETPVIIQEENLDNGADGFTNVTVPESYQSNTSVELIGTFETINSRATNVRIQLSDITDIRTLVLNAVAAVLGNGVIRTAEINADGSTISSRPQNVVLDIDGGGSVQIGEESITESYSVAAEARLTNILADQYSISLSFDNYVAGLSINNFNLTATLDEQEYELQNLRYDSAKKRFTYTPLDLTGNIGKELEITVAPAETTTGDSIKVIGEPQKTTVTIKNGFAGRITDIQGLGVEGARLKFRKGSGTTEGEIVGEAITNKYGYYSIALEPGTYTGELVKQGFITTYVLGVSAEDKFLTDQNETAIRAAASEEIKIMLSWGKDPEDLDSHLTGPTLDQEEWFHTYFANEVYENGDITYVDLDWDDTDSYGPETTTIRKLVDGKYIFFVHNYSQNYYYDEESEDFTTSDSITLRNSSAKVQIFKGNSLVANEIFNVPNGTDDEYYWVVFSLDVSKNGTDMSITAIDYLTDFASWSEFDDIPEEVQQFKDPRHAIEQKLEYAQTLHSTDSTLATAMSEAQAVLANQNATQAELYAKLIKLLNAIEPLRDGVYDEEILADLQLALNQIPADLDTINKENINSYADLLDNIYHYEENALENGITSAQLEALNNYNRIEAFENVVYKITTMLDLQSALNSIPADLNTINSDNVQIYEDLLYEIKWLENSATESGNSIEEIEALINYDKIQAFEEIINQLLGNEPMLLDISVIDGGTEGTLTTGDTIQFTFSSAIPPEIFADTVKVEVSDGLTNDLIEIYRNEEDDFPIRLRVLNADYADVFSSATFTGSVSYDSEGNINITLDELESEIGVINIITGEVELVPDETMIIE